MGIIKEGKISGKLPCTKAFVVHYPAYPSSIERAIDTLGGTKLIAMTRTSETNKLELRFRPEDPYSHPAFGELQPCNNFLLRISNINLKNTQEDEVRNRVLERSPSSNSVSLEKETSSTVLKETAEQASQSGTECDAFHTNMEGLVPQEAEEILSADIVACVPEAYHFNGMADYQHVPAIHADIARKKKKNWVEFENGGLVDVDQEDLMILLPPLFSLKDLPTNVVLRPPACLNLKRKHEGLVKHYWESDIEPSLALDFYIKEIPKKVNWEKHIPEGSKHWVWQKAVCELFDERPIWVKDSLSERLHEKGLEFGVAMLRRLLFRAAYYFSNGPFLRFWIKKGYDPRKDPESRIYQRTDFRVPPSLRSYCDNNLASGLKLKWQDLCTFQVFPYKCHTSFQLVELADDYIQEEIRKPPTLATCTCATGWFSSAVLDSLRLCVAVRFLSVYPNGGASSLLKFVSRRFEKSKRLRMHPKGLQQSEGQECNAEIIENEENGPNNSDEKDEDEAYEEDEEAEEDEVEDDNIEDDLDAYEALNLDENFSPQQHPHMNENLSKNFLQELFVSFPDKVEGVNEPDHVNGSDGEYEIYEQSSDNSDEDD